MLKIILVRHGETAWNSGKRIQGGLSDQPLSQKGAEQAQKAALSLKNEKLTTIYSSPLKRALATAQAIAGHHELEVAVMPGFAEVNAGLLEGLTIEELTSQHHDFYQAFLRGDGPLRMPGGESLAELQSRAWAAVEDIRHRHPQGVVSIVSHAFCLSTIMCRALNLELGNFIRFRFAAAGISVLHFEADRVFLMRFNDTCHLTEVSLSGV